MDSDKMPTVEEEFLDALDVLWRQHGNEDPGYKAMLPFVKQIADLQAKVANLRTLVSEQDSMLGRKACAGLNADGKPRCIELAKVQAERDALAKDAARYRWLRDSYDPSVHDDDGGSFMRAAGDELDAAIDSAMAEGER